MICTVNYCVRIKKYEPAGVFADYMHITLLKPGALSVLRGYGIQSCLLNRDEALATLLSALPDWQSVYSDQTSILLVRRNIPNAAATSH